MNIKKNENTFANIGFFLGVISIIVPVFIVLAYYLTPDKISKILSAVNLVTIITYISRVGALLLGVISLIKDSYKTKAIIIINLSLLSWIIPRILSHLLSSLI
jgi:hypothetical protein